ncbi:hypothetical protein CHLNCDRAFT_143443 [Chlorella variabilis]|uniref:LysM domain-containing protein n=1 Tax=Chlorella variabilis TaxID=554065 RepID=E1ZAX4_CHLVA|nr:hypothetical protein CHLNCDRAFT_143443 [Chlorella variabilis]EFN56925.1 hypothetical protein CHLNCDRAFT_143443 [Chlorella variabilis]|eukprot:XP_005849027.1 hypothetical protein CHLNCDRAFT_143443 [Chlorella variabilis]
MPQSELGHERIGRMAPAAPPLPPPARAAEDDPVPEEEEAGRTWASVADLVSSRNLTSVLEAALEAAGQLEQLSDPSLVATVLAPTDEAFAAALESLGMSVEELLADTELLAQVLPYHVIPGQALTAGDLEDGEILQTQLGGQAGELKVKAGRTRPRLETTSGQTASIKNADLVAGSALVHTVLIPGSDVFESSGVGAPSPAPAEAPAAPPLPPPPSPPALCTHTLAAGEFLSSLADTYGISPDELLALNPQISNPDSLALGAVLNVPCLEA